MVIGLMFAFAMQSVSSAEVAKPRRVSEELYYLDPYQREGLSCNRRVAKQQSRIFRRRFERRIEALKQKEASVLGPDPGFEVVPIGHCRKSQGVRSSSFVAGLDRFDADLASLEARYP